MDLTIKQVWTKYWKDVCEVDEYNKNHLKQANGCKLNYVETLLSHCAFVFLFFFFVHRHLEEKQSSPRKQKKQAITDNSICVSLLDFFFLSKTHYSLSLCRWHTHGDFFPIILAHVWFWMFYLRDICIVFAVGLWLWISSQLH